MTTFLRMTALVLLWASNSWGAEVAYFYALDADLKTLREAGTVVGKPYPLGGQTVTTVRLETHTVRAVKMGTGCVNTAAVAAALLTRFPCDVAISTGPAGGLSDHLSLNQWVRIQSVVSFGEGAETTSGFVLARNAQDRVVGSSLPPDTPEQFKNCENVSIASGNVFVSSSVYRTRLRQLTEADAVDMNMSGLMVTSRNANVPLLCWKIISDFADDDASAAFERFLKGYNGSGGRLVAEYISKLQSDPNRVNSHSNLRKLLNQGSKLPP